MPWWFLKQFIKREKSKMAKIKLDKNSLSYLLEDGLAKNNQNCLILHGWGANKEFMKDIFLKQVKNNFEKIIFLDLPGFGNSNEPLKSFDSFECLEIVLEFINKINLNINCILGHSYGAKLAALYASKYKLDKLILIACAGIVCKKSFKTRLKIKLSKCLKLFKINKNPFVSKDAINLSKIMYESFKRVVDEDFTLYFSKITSKTLILWGKEDNATKLKAGKIIHSLIKNSYFYEFSGDHFFFIQNDTSLLIQNFLNDKLDNKIL